MATNLLRTWVDDGVDDLDGAGDPIGSGMIQHKTSTSLL